VVELVHHGLHHAVQELLTPGYVAVQGHGLDAEARPESPHGEVLDPVLVDEADRLVQDGHLVQSAARGQVTGVSRRLRRSTVLSLEHMLCWLLVGHGHPLGGW
jgi:hypothetical protein